MKNLVKLALVAVTAGGLTVGFACDKEGATAEKAGCNHGAKAQERELHGTERTLERLLLGCGEYIVQ